MLEEKFTKEQIIKALITTNGNRTEAAKVLGCARPTITKYLSRYKDILEIFSSELSKHIEEVGFKMLELAKNGDVKAAELVFKHFSRYNEFAAQQLDSSSRIMLSKLKKGLVTAKEAALDFEIRGLIVPETVKTLLSHEQQEPVDPSAGQYATISDEEMEERAKQRRQQIEEEKNQWLPARREEVAALKETVADAFVDTEDNE